MCSRKFEKKTINHIIWQRIFWWCILISWIWSFKDGSETIIFGISCWVIKLKRLYYIDCICTVYRISLTYLENTSIIMRSFCPPTQIAYIWIISIGLNGVGVNINFRHCRIPIVSNWLTYITYIDKIFYMYRWAFIYFFISVLVLFMARWLFDPSW